MMEKAADVNANGGTRPASLWLVELGALVASVVANVALWWVSTAALEISPEFPPLVGPAPTIFFTAIGVGGGVVAFAIIRRFFDHPVRLFRRVAASALVLSLVPDIWLWSDGAAAQFPGASVAAVSVLMLMHVVAAGIVVWTLTGVVGRDPQAD